MVKRKYLYISNLVEESSREKALELSRHSSELEVIVNLQVILHLLYLFDNMNRRIKCFTSEMHIVKCWKKRSVANHATISATVKLNLVANKCKLITHPCTQVIITPHFFNTANGHLSCICASALFLSYSFYHQICSTKGYSANH